MGRAWTTGELKKLKDMYKAGMSDYEIAEVLDRSFEGVRTKRSNLGLVSAKKWSKNDIYEAYSAVCAAAEKLGRSPKAVCYKLHNLMKEGYFDDA